ncbi:unnamed protein product [Amoebophrya sp. A25]|nr:unnamed protein product [Amoebophrya sp. A25]|eukprot:GSA25T00024366001.1
MSYTGFTGGSSASSSGFQGSASASPDSTSVARSSSTGAGAPGPAVPVPPGAVGFPFGHNGPPSTNHAAIATSTGAGAPGLPQAPGPRAFSQATYGGQNVNGSMPNGNAANKISWARKQSEPSVVVSENNDRGKGLLLAHGITVVDPGRSSSYAGSASGSSSSSREEASGGGGGLKMFSGTTSIPPGAAAGSSSARTTASSNSSNSSAASTNHGRRSSGASSSGKKSSGGTSSSGRNAGPLDYPVICLERGIEVCTTEEENRVELRPRWKVAQIVELRGGLARVQVVANPLSADHGVSRLAPEQLPGSTFGAVLDGGYSLSFWVDLYGNCVQPFGTHTVKPSTRRPVWSFLHPPNPPHITCGNPPHMTGESSASPIDDNFSSPRSRNVCTWEGTWNAEQQDGDADDESRLDFIDRSQLFAGF